MESVYICAQAFSASLKRSLNLSANKYYYYYYRGDVGGTQPRAADNLHKHDHDGTDAAGPQELH